MLGDNVKGKLCLLLLEYLKLKFVCLYLVALGHIAKQQLVFVLMGRDLNLLEVLKWRQEIIYFLHLKVHSHISPCFNDASLIASCCW